MYRIEPSHEGFNALWEASGSVNGYIMKNVQCSDEYA